MTSNNNSTDNNDRSEPATGAESGISTARRRRIVIGNNGTTIPSIRIIRRNQTNANVNRTNATRNTTTADSNAASNVASNTNQMSGQSSSVPATTNTDAHTDANTSSNDSNTTNNDTNADTIRNTRILNMDGTDVRDSDLPPAVLNAVRMMENGRLSNNIQSISTNYDPAERQQQSQPQQQQQQNINLVNGTSARVSIEDMNSNIHLRPHIHVNHHPNQNSNGTSRISLPPLQPQRANYKPKSSTNTSTTDEHKNSNEAEEREFECAICFECMEHPTGCGKCDARFCLSCIRRVITLTSTSDPNTTAKCPYCRTEIDNIQQDVALQQKIERCKIVKECPYPQCTKSFPLSKIRAHEASCDCIPMKCKYASFGCSWTGPRRDLDAHYKVGCSLAKVDGLVEELRCFKYEHKSLVVHLQNTLARERHISLHQIESLRALQTKKLGNVFDFIYFTYSSVCHSENFFRTKSLWQAYWSSEEARGTVNNLLYLFPSSLWVFKIGWVGMSTIPHILNMNAENFNIDPVIVLMKSCCVLILWLLLVACFVSLTGPHARNNQVLFYNYVLNSTLISPFLCKHDTIQFMDNGSSTTWGSNSVELPFSHRELRGSFVKHCAMLTSFYLHYACIDFDGWGDSVMGKFWTCLLLLTVFFPPIVDTILTAASMANLPDDRSLETTKPLGKASSVFMIGVKFAALINAGDSPAADAIFIHQLLAIWGIFPKQCTHEETVDYLSLIDTSFICVTLASRIGISAKKIYKENMRLDMHVTCVCICICFLLLIDFLFNNLQKFGVESGNKIVRRAKSNGGLPRDQNRVYDQSGNFHFVIWSILSFIPLLAIPILHF